MEKLGSDLHTAMNKVWMCSHRDGSSFSLPHAGKEMASLIKRLDSLGYVEEIFEVPGREPGVNGKITSKGREYYQEYFGNPPIRL